MIFYSKIRLGVSLVLFVFMVIFAACNQGEELAKSLTRTAETLATKTSSQVANSTASPLTETGAPTTEAPIPAGTDRPKLTATPITVPLITSDKDGMTMVSVPTGKFLMGAPDSYDPDKDETPPHEVYLDAFWIDQFEVTNAMFMRFVAATHYQTDAEKTGVGYVFNLSSEEPDPVEGAYWQHPRGLDSSIDGPDHPVVQVSWNDVLAYCKWVGRRLPTEAEWEKAARGTDGRKYPWGNQDAAENLLNYADSNIPMEWADRSENDGYKYTAPVGNYPDGKSPYGALDMAGNVWEWTADWYDELYYGISPSENPTGASSGGNRVARGGSWNRAAFFRTTYRYGLDPSRSFDDVGFRCAYSPLASQESTTSFAPSQSPFTSTLIITDTFDRDEHNLNIWQPPSNAEIIFVRDGVLNILMTPRHVEAGEASSLYATASTQPIREIAWTMTMVSFATSGEGGVALRVFMSDGANHYISMTHGGQANIEMGICMQLTCSGNYIGNYDEYRHPDVRHIKEGIPVRLRIVWERNELGFYVEEGRHAVAPAKDTPITDFRFTLYALDGGAFHVTVDDVVIKYVDN